MRRDDGSSARSRTSLSKPQHEETPEERRARRLAKKLEKQRRREMAPEAEVAREMGYTNDSNPFGDANLQDKFVWKAKHQKLRESGIDPERHERELAHQRRFALKDEVSKVKARRDEREEEKELWEREQRRMQLEREMGTLEEWQKQEEKFHAEQAKQRATIRLKEGMFRGGSRIAQFHVSSSFCLGRAKPIDRIYKNLTVLDDVDFDIRGSVLRRLFRSHLSCFPTPKTPFLCAQNRIWC